ncbi:MAG: MoaD/ThiS family protein, partial [Acidobacteria bacterium]|nr:MoaD/ThiS family protein [Acidobacteriota bacterium]
MGYRVLIPTPLRPYTDQQDAVDVEGQTVGDALAALTDRYTALRRHLYGDDGKMRHFVNVYVNDDDIRYLDREATALKAGDVISIIPSVAGGAPVTETAASPELTHAEVHRYSRHLILPEVGPDGQRRLKAGRVLCVGAGGLGSPAALYL